MFLLELKVQCGKFGTEILKASVKTASEYDYLHLSMFKNWTITASQNPL